MHYEKATEVQSKTLVRGLQEKDILGAARTGSGKTLAFLIPVLENLYRKRWTEFDGLGALIISPTRELAMQIFTVLRKIGRKHTFSAALVIGGKDLAEERSRLTSINVLVCTPGRLLQHMDQTAGFEANNLQMLVLDEADRILDMGFEKTLDAIIANLPKQSRQTMLFSATQTKRVKDLARLSLRDPEYVSVHEHEATTTPAELQQFCATVRDDEKLHNLYGFIKTHLKTKTVVFFASCKQVRFVYECFRRLRPGVPLLHLHGNQKQATRSEVVAKFSAAQRSILFATDVAARGLDFPAVDWIVQIDAPEDVDTYIHRVGRTARLGREGKALLFVTPSEQLTLTTNLKRRKIPIRDIVIKPTRHSEISTRIQAFLIEDTDLKRMAERVSALFGYERPMLSNRLSELTFVLFKFGLTKRCSRLRAFPLKLWLKALDWAAPLNYAPE